MRFNMARTRTAGRWGSILLALAPALAQAIKRHGRHVDCPLPGHEADGKNDFRMFPDFEDTGGAICTCGCYSDGFSLLQRMHGWTPKEVLKQVDGYLTGISPMVPTRRPVPAPRPEDPEAHRKEDTDRIMRLRQMWNEAVPLSDHNQAKVAWWYLESRHIRGQVVKDFKTLRLHPGLPFYDSEGDYQGHFPALLACFSNTHNVPVTIHRTYLTHTGAKLPVENAKKVMPLASIHKMAGGAIRFGKPGRVLGVAEGIETALSVYCATRKIVWSCYSANGIASFVPPTGVEEVWAWADSDLPNSKTGLRAGHEAAKELKARLWEKKIMCRIMIPPIPLSENGKGVDWNDVLVMQGVMGFPAAYRMASTFIPDAAPKAG